MSPASPSNLSSPSPAPRHAAPQSATIGERRTDVFVDGNKAGIPWAPGRVARVIGLPLAVVAIGGGTLWGVAHVERELETETLSDLGGAAIDTASLSVDYSYRDGKITGELPAGVTVTQVKDVVDYRGIRTLEVNAAVAAPTPEPAADPTAEPAVAEQTGPVEVQAVVADGGVVLSGTVLSEGQRESLVDAARARYSVETVDDQLVVSGLAELTPGADARADALAALISALPDGVEGQALLDDTSLAFNGVAADQAAADEVAAALDTVSAVTTTNSIEVESAAAPTVEEEIDLLQAELDALADEIRETVVFGTSSDELSSPGQATLDKVAEAMNRFQLPVVRVSGHTDSRGPAELNQTLSQTRAGSVEAYLTSAGVAEDRLESRGAGEEEPVASNETEEGRAENRRVELTALASF